MPRFAPTCVQISDSLYIGDKPGSIACVEAVSRKYLRGFPSLFFVYKATVRVVLQETPSITITAIDESFHGKHRLAFPVHKLQGVGPNEIYFLFERGFSGEYVPLNEMAMDNGSAYGLLPSADPNY